MYKTALTILTHHDYSTISTIRSMEMYTHSVLIDHINDGNQLSLIATARDSRYTSSLHESCETLKKITKLFLVNSFS